MKYIVESMRAKSGKTELNETEKAFLDLILSGMTNVDAALESGLVEGDEDDKEVRIKASKTASNLINTRRAQRYISFNRQTAVVYTEQDLPALATRIYDIAMGNAEGDYVTNDGSVIKVKPSFKDQIAAANWIRAYTNDLKKEVKPTSKAKNKAIDAIAIEFASKYDTRKVDDFGVPMNKINSPKRNKNDKYMELMASTEIMDGMISKEDESDG